MPGTQERKADMDIITVDEHEYILDFEFEGWAYLRPVRDGTAYLPGICVPVDALPQTKDETEKS